MFGKFGANILGGETAGESEAVDWLSDTIKQQLHTTNSSFDLDADENAADVTNEVANGNGYTTGGVTIGSKTLTYNATGNKTVADGADPTWTASGAGFSASDGILVDTTPDQLIQTLPFGSTITLASGDTLTINVDATNGFFYVTSV